MAAFPPGSIVRLRCIRGEAGDPRQLEFALVLSHGEIHGRRRPELRIAPISCAPADASDLDVIVGPGEATWSRGTPFHIEIWNQRVALVEDFDAPAIGEIDENVLAAVYAVHNSLIGLASRMTEPGRVGPPVTDPDDPRIQAMKLRIELAEPISVAVESALLGLRGQDA